MKERLQEILRTVMEDGTIHPECDDTGCLDRGRREVCYLRGYKMCRQYKPHSKVNQRDMWSNPRGWAK